MNHVKLRQKYNSIKELIQPPLSSFERGYRSMHHSIGMRRNIGERYACVPNVLFDEHIYYFTMFMQDIVPRRITIPYKFHGQLWATKIYEHGHSLRVQWEILYHCGCIPKAPNISHTFNHGEKTWAASKQWGSHLPYVMFLFQDCT